MAEIAIGVATSHAAQLKMPASAWPMLVDKDRRDRRMDFEALLARELPGIDRQITPEEMERRSAACQAGLDRLQTALAEAAPDVMLVIGDDQHEQFLEDNMPMFSVYRGGTLATGKNERAWSNDRTFGASDRPWMKAQEPIHRSVRQFEAVPALAEHLIQHLIDADFDVATSNELRAGTGIGHAFAFVYNRLVPDGRIPMVPFMVNTFFAPNPPTPRRCYALGRALRDAIADWDTDQRVAVIASGGLSHTVIDEELDWLLIDGIREKNADLLRSLPEDRLIRGTSEIRNWIVAAGALEAMEMTLADYVPCYRSLAGTGCAMGFATWS
jgi:hypothetical protein